MRYLGLRLRLALELAAHRREHRAYLRHQGASQWSAWRIARMPRAARRELTLHCFPPADEATARACYHARGVIPGFLMLATLLLLTVGRLSTEVRASLVHRVPGAAGAMLIEDLSLRQWQGLHLRSSAAFHYQYMNWDGPRGQQPVVVLQTAGPFAASVGIKNVSPTSTLVASDFFALHGIRAGAKSIVLDGRRYQIGGFISPSDWYLFRGAQIWVPFDAKADPRTGVDVIAPTSALRIPGHALISLADYLLDNLSLPRYCALALWLVWLLSAGRPRRWLYALHSVVVSAAWLLLWLTVWGYLAELQINLDTAVAALVAVALMVSTVLGLAWAREDHRRRCRICLRRLRMPLGEGCWGSILFAAPATELICPHGHGKLVLPRSRRQPQPRERWSFAGDYWQELVAAARPTRPC